MRATLLALCVPAICLAQAAQPRLTLNANHYDFGMIAPDQVVSYRFKATNTGNATLTIAELKPACGCTSTVVGKQVLAPGESTELEVSFNPAAETGRVQKSVTVVSDDPVAPGQILTFEAEVQPLVIPAARTVVIRDLVRSDRRKTSVKVESGTRSPIRVTNVELSTAPWLGVATREEGKDLWVDLELLAGRLPANKLSGTDTITLRLANPGPATANLKVLWELRPPVTVTPPRLAWVEPVGQELSATVLLTGPLHKPFRILAARTTNPLFTVRAIPAKAAVRQRVEVTLSATTPPGLYEEKAILTLDTPGHPELEIHLAAALH